MISRVFRGARVRGLLAYLYGEGRRNEHDNPRLVASWDGYPQGWEPIRGADGRYRVAALARLLETPVRTSAGVSDKPVYHLVLRNPDADRVLSDAEWAEVAAAAMARTGIAPDGDPSGCKWVAARHDDTHIHVVATLARQDGRAPNTYGDFKNLRAVCHHYERRWGLTPTAPADGTAAGRAGVREQVTAEQQGRAEPPRDTLRRAVAAAAAGSRNPDEFVEALGRAGVQVQLRYSTTQPDQVTGYSVSLGGHTDAAGNPIRFGGGKLAPDLSWPKLHARWMPVTAGSNRTRANSDADGRSAGSSPGASAAAEGLGEAGRDRLWEHAQRLVDEAAEQIRRQAGDDPDGAADAAWAASDAMRSVAWAAEGAAGGPLSAAAEAFARAGRHPYRRIPTPSDTGHSLRTVARLTAVLSTGSGGTAAGSLALLAGLAALARALADLREAQQRAHQVAAARRAAEQLRTVAPPPRADPTRPGGRDDDPRTRRGRDRSDRNPRDRRRPTPGAGDLKPPPRTGGWTRPGPSAGHGLER